jgi:hypothetical protein
MEILTVGLGYISLASDLKMDEWNLLGFFSGCELTCKDWSTPDICCC